MGWPTVRIFHFPSRSFNLSNTHNDPLYLAVFQYGNYEKIIGRSLTPVIISGRSLTPAHRALIYYLANYLAGYVLHLPENTNVQSHHLLTTMYLPQLFQTLYLALK